jgi:hypothetical protein
MKNLFKPILLILVIFPYLLFSQPNFPREPEKAQLVSTDVKNFIEAYDNLSPEKDNVKVLQEFYFAKASPGLKEYISRFKLTPEMLSTAIEKNPEKYASIKKFYGQISDFENVYRDELRNYQKTLPKALFPPTYLLVGAYKGIGQASRVGQLITIEKAIANEESLKNLIIHELTHFQQAFTMGLAKYGGLYGQKNNMLGVILREGGAEFITYKLVRKNVHQFRKLEDLKKNEFALWERFKIDLKNQDNTFWVDVSFEDNNKGYPIQLGYAVGYRIVESYYNNAVDKNQALEDILIISDANEFLAKSKYQPDLSKLQKELMFGKPNPNAPAEITDYKELIGINDCTSQRRKADGTWPEPQKISWTFKYILDGMAVQDETYKPDGAHAGSIREYSKEDKKWYVHFYSTPSKASKQLSTWEGNRTGNEMILLREQKAPNGADGYYKIRFYNISPEGFDWLGAWVSKDESVVFETWKIGCRKRY